MNLINDTIVSTILTTVHPHSTIENIEWTIEANVSNAGCNYMSETSRLKITYTKDTHHMSKSFFLKIPSNAPTYEMLKSIGGLHKEMVMYTKILPQMYTIEDKRFTARCYYIDDKISLILKDLTQSGYRCADRIEQLDFEHCYHAFRCLAKLHALSAAFESSLNISSLIKYGNENENIGNAENLLSGIPYFVENLPQHVKKTYPQQIRNLGNLRWKSVAEDQSAQANTFNVLNHADFLTNNIMFKYNKYGVIEKVKLIDFQFLQWCSPAIDIIHFTITSMKFDVYEKHFDLLLDVYLDTLNKMLVKLHQPTYSKLDLLYDIDRRYHYACYVFTCISPIILSKKPFDLEEIRDGFRWEYSDNFTVYRQPNLIDVGTKWFLHYVRKGVLNNDEKIIKSGKADLKK